MDKSFCYKILDTRTGKFYRPYGRNSSCWFSEHWVKNKLNILNRRYDNRYELVKFELVECKSGQ